MMPKDLAADNARVAIQVLRRYAGRPRSDVEDAARRALFRGASSMAVASALFVMAALSLIPESGPWGNILLALLAIFIGFFGLIEANLWNILDRELHGEHVADRESQRPRPRWGARWILEAVVEGGFVGLAVKWASDVDSANPMSVLLFVAAVLFAVAFALVFRDAEKRRARRA